MLTRKLAETVIDVPSGSIADEFLAKAEDGLIDTIGVMLAGSREDVALIAQRWSTDFPSTPTASVLGTSLATSPAEAAFANGIAGHALDFDDSLPSCAGIRARRWCPSALAVAEATGPSGPSRARRVSRSGWRSPQARPRDRRRALQTRMAHQRDHRRLLRDGRGRAAVGSLRRAAPDRVGHRGVAGRRASSATSAR